MTNQNSVLTQILRVANDDERVRAVYLGGSRTDPNVNPDSYQDYDVAFVVTDTRSFVRNPDWIRVFGTPVMVQEPYKSEFGWGDAADDATRYAWLFILENGVRIDLQVQVVGAAIAGFEDESLREILLDKDGLLPKDVDSNDRSFWEQCPTENEYLACCNEFWWCLNNGAKAVARGQFAYAIADLNGQVRQMLVQMLGWYVGGRHEWHVSIGKNGKFLQKYLSAEEHALLNASFPHADKAEIWRAVDAITSLFVTASKSVASDNDFIYPIRWEVGMKSFLHAVRQGKRPGEMTLSSCSG